MTRSRLAVAALSAAALGLAAVLVPTASIAEPITETPAASAEVIWADGADDFVSVDVEGESLSIPQDTWSWTAPVIEGASLGDYAAFDANGVTRKGDEPFALLRASSSPVTGADLPAVLDDASLNAGAEVGFGVLVATAEDPDQFVGTAIAIGGFQGPDTQWQADGTFDSAGFAAWLTEEDLVVVGYALSFPGALPPVSPEPTATLNSDEDVLVPLSELLTAPAQGFAARAAEPGAVGAASLRFGDLTTYFTPQPTAVLTLASANVTSTQATTAGVAVTGSGFAPGETVTVGIGTGAMGDQLPVTFVADADGNVSGTVVLPATWAEAGQYSLVLIGASSGQFASSALVITAAAPVAVPVPGRATYTG